MIKFLKVENIIIGEARAANPYDCSNNGTRRGSDTEYSNHTILRKNKKVLATLPISTIG